MKRLRERLSSKNPVAFPSSPRSVCLSQSENVSQGSKSPVSRKVTWTLGKFFFFSGCVTLPAVCVETSRVF